jgi:hypothetical protein
MALLIDVLYVLRELGKLLFVIVTSPFAFAAGLLTVLGSN